MEDEFGNLSNDDFFKKYQNGKREEDFIDENGEIDYEKMREESFRMFEALTGRKIEDFIDKDFLNNEQLFPSLDDNKIGMGFVQDLDSEEGKKMFENLVKQHDLIKESKAVERGGDKYVEEIWSNKDNTVRVKRVYNLNENTSAMLSPEEQIDMYEQKLEECVEVEDYEEAAKLRDVIKELKSA